MKFDELDTQMRVSCQTFKTLFLSSRTLAVRDLVKKFRCKTAYLKPPTISMFYLEYSW